MKLFVSILACIILPQVAGAQIDEKKREHALFEVTQHGAHAVYTDVIRFEEAFDERAARNITNNIMEKDGIFGVELRDEGKTLRVFHLTRIDVEGIKSFILPHTENFHVEEPVPYQL